MPLFFVRPAWAHTCGCKSRCDLVTVSKVKGNGEGQLCQGDRSWEGNVERTSRFDEQEPQTGCCHAGRAGKGLQRAMINIRLCRCGGCVMKVGASCLDLSPVPAAQYRFPTAAPVGLSMTPARRLFLLSMRLP